MPPRPPRRPRITRPHASTALLACLALPAGGAAGQVSANLALTSDYVWRGSSQAMQDPAVQAGVKLSSASGWYGSVWGSNVEFAPGLEASSEFDFAIGWSGQAGEDWTLDAYVLRYVYPGTTADLDWTELDASATWRDRAWVGFGWSGDAMATGESGTYVNAGVRFPANDALRFELGAGRYFLDDAAGDGELGDYSHGWASAIWTVYAPAQDKRVELRLTGHATDGAAKDRFGDDLAGGRFEAALQASF